MTTPPDSLDALAQTVEVALMRGESDSVVKNNLLRGSLKPNPEITAGREAFAAYRRQVAALTAENERMRAFVAKVREQCGSNLFVLKKSERWDEELAAETINLVTESMVDLAKESDTLLQTPLPMVPTENKNTPTT